MLFSTVLEDALYLSWAVPFEAVPSPPAPLRLERFPGPEGDRALITLVLFRQAGIRAEALGWPRLSYPQVNLRLAVLDEEAVASVLLLRELVPAWVVPIARTAGGSRRAPRCSVSRRRRRPACSSPAPGPSPREPGSRSARRPGLRQPAEP